MRMNKTCYSQTNSLWGGLGYPKAPWYIRNCGCGEVAVTNSLIEMERYDNYTPKTTQPYMKQYAESRGNGTYHYGIPASLKHYGLTEVAEHSTMSKLWAQLKKGNRIAILLMGSKRAGSKRVRWTGSGHFVAVTGYKEKDGKHYVYVKDSASKSSLRNGWITYEDNIRGACLKCWSGKLTGDLYDGKSEAPAVEDGKLAVDGIGGSATVKAMQRFFSTTQDGVISGQSKVQAQFYPALKSVQYGKGGSACIKNLQKWVGTEQDGILGKGTVAAWQKKLKDAKYYTGIIDGYFGAMSMEAWQKYLNDHDKAEFPKTQEPSANAKKIIAKAKLFCWPLGTAEKKWSYNTGSPLKVYVIACKKFMKKTAKVSLSDCGYFVSTCVRAADVDSDFTALGGSGDSFPKVPEQFKLVLSGKKIPSGTLLPGDIIRYKKKSGQHTLMYYSNGVIAEAGRKTRFPVLRKDTKKYNADNVKHSTIQVLRAK